MTREQITGQKSALTKSIRRFESNIRHNEEVRAWLKANPSAQHQYQQLIYIVSLLRSQYRQVRHLREERLILDVVTPTEN